MIQNGFSRESSRDAKAQRAFSFFISSLLALTFILAPLSSADARSSRDSLYSRYTGGERIGNRYERPRTQHPTYVEQEQEYIPPSEEPVPPIYVPDGKTIEEAKHSKDKRITLRDLGLLQLAAHDFFNVDRDTEIDHENGKLDLSTLLDHGYHNIAIGGEARNRENIILFSVAKEYGELYVKLENKRGERYAKNRLLDKYHRELKDAYKTLFEEDMPNPKRGTATLTENLALRTIHDLLPGEILFRGHMIQTVDHSLVGKSLSRQELKEKSGFLDGKLPIEFQNIVIVIPPSTILSIDLLERDSSFASQFGTDFTFEHFLSEIEDGSYDKKDDVLKLIRSLFAKGLNI